MANYFIYNNSHSLEDYKMYFEIIPTLPLLNPLDKDNIIVCTLGFKTDSQKLLEIKKWLSNKNGELKFSFDDRVWAVTNILADEIVKNKSYTVISVSFTVDNYCVIPDNEINIESNFDEITIYNQGNYSCKPIFEIYGTGNITISINGYITTIENVEGAITIDSKIEEAWQGNSLNINSLKTSEVYGDFPMFLEGDNYISITSTGSIKSVKINPRWII